MADIRALDEPQRRLTAVHSRYHVGCGICGFVEAYSDQFCAFKSATAHYHNESEVSVFDSMARRGGPQMWMYNGRQWTMTETRPRKETPS